MPPITLFGGFKSVLPLQFRKSTKSKGKKLLPHVFNVKEVSEEGKATIILGNVGRQTSVRKAVRIITLELDSERNITTMHCGCVSGADGDCKHVFAVINYVNSERHESQTDQQCQWIKPKQWGEKMYPKGREMDEIVKTKEKAEKARFLCPTQQEQNERLALLQRIGDTGSQMYMLLQAEPVISVACLA